MKINNKILIASLVIAGLSSSGTFGATKICGTGNCAVPTGVECDTYQEVVIERPISSTTTIHTHVLLAAPKESNCGPLQSYTGQNNIAIAATESIEHSCTGSLTSTVGFNVGTAGVAAASLQHATTHANGWKKLDTYATTLTHVWNFDVPQCKIHRIQVFGDWIAGSASGSGYIHSYYFNWDTGDWESTDCSETSSSAGSQNKVYSNLSGETLPEQNCPSGCTPIS